MKTRLFPSLFLLLLFYGTNVLSAQQSFESGYYIDNAGNKQNCLINNKDWGSSPKVIQYRLNYNDPIQEFFPSDIQEFGITQGDRYISAEVQIDRSPDQLNTMSTKRNPQWSKEYLFLKVLVDGNADLFFFGQNTLQRFFYRTSSNDSIRQLVYKRYMANDNSIAANTYFQQQLWRDINCDGPSIDWFDRLQYTATSLGNYFLKYNECKGGDLSTNSIPQNQDFFNLRLNPGINIATVSLDSEVPEIQNTNFGTKLNVRFGVEFEFILPQKKERWSLLFEPVFQVFTDETNVGSDQASLSFPSLDFALGGRRYLPLENGNKIFADALYVPGFTIDFNSSIEYQSGTSFSVLARHGLALGVGWQSQHVQVGGRLYFPKSLGEQYSALTIPYTAFHLFAGFQIW